MLKVPNALHGAVEDIRDAQAASSEINARSLALKALAQLEKKRMVFETLDQNMTKWGVLFDWEGLLEVMAKKADGHADQGLTLEAKKAARNTAEWLRTFRSQAPVDNYLGHILTLLDLTIIELRQALRFPHQEMQDRLTTVSSLLRNTIDAFVVPLAPTRG